MSAANEVRPGRTELTNHDAKQLRAADESRLQGNGLPPLAPRHRSAGAGLKVQSGINAGGLAALNHHEAQGGLRVQSGIKAGSVRYLNHNETQGGSKVQSGIKAGGLTIGNHNESQARQPAPAPAGGSSCRA